MGYIDTLPCVVETARGPVPGELLPPAATLTVEGKRFQVLRVLLDRPLRKSSTSNAEYIQRFEGALTR